jgi:hypothetical protein
LAYYHVRINRRSVKSSDVIKLDLSEAELRTRFLNPYYADTPITIGGQVIEPSDIHYIHINKTEQDSSVLRPRVIAELRARGGGAVTVPIDWYVAKSGEEVTDQLITGPPGSGRAMSARPTRSDSSTEGDGRIFVIMPLSEDWSRGVYDMIKRVVESLGLDPRTDVYRADDVAKPGRITDQIVEAIETASVIVADISELNPNVMWELGYSQAKGKQVVMINQEIAASPFDIRDYRQVAYTPFPTQQHQDALTEALRAVLPPSPPDSRT